MATNDVPGAKVHNNDKLARGCWAEHEDGSMIYVKDIDENGRVIFDIYELADADHPTFYPHALSKKDFEETFSYDPKKIGVANLKWVWHNRTPMPWERVMRIFDTPVPALVNAVDTISAAKRVANSLKLRMGRSLDRSHILAAQGLEDRGPEKTSSKLLRRFANAMKAFREDA